MSPIDDRIYTLPTPSPVENLVPPDMGMWGDPRGGQCPAPWTNILLKDNETKQAKDLKVGDLVHTQHEDTLKWGDYPVEAVKIIPDQKRLSFVFDDGVELVCSLSHKFYLNNTWVEAKDIKINDILTNKKVTEVKPYEDGDVVLITITDAHTYISEGILSHNKSLARPPEGDYIASTPNRTGVDMTGARVPSSGISSGNPLNSDGYLGGRFGEAFKLNPETNQYERYEVLTSFDGRTPPKYRSTGQVIGQSEYDQLYNQAAQAQQRYEAQVAQRQGGGLVNQFFGGNTPFNPNISAGSSTPSTGAILGGLGATALGGLFGGASGASGVLGNLLNLYGSYQGSQANQNINQGLAQGYGSLANQLQSQVQFKPFTVTGSTGGVGTGYDAQGNLQTQYGLNPQGQAIQQAGLGGAQGFLTEAQQPIAQTEQDIFNRMLQVAAPERERQQLALEERLAAQGRLGTSSAAYGGATPEQMALATAQQQQLNQLGLQARGQALSERGQALEMGRGLLSAGFAPEAQLLNLIQPAINISSLQGTGQREGANLAAQLQIAQMQAQANAAKAEANRRAQLTGAAGGFLTGQQTGGGPSIFEQLLGGLFGGSFGGRQPDFIKDVYNTPQTTTNQPNPDIYGMA
jgi:hypothetical protein